MFPSKHYGLMRTMGENKSALPDLMHFPYFTECLFLMHYSLANRRKMPSLFFLCGHYGFKGQSLSYQSNLVVFTYIKGNGWYKIFREGCGKGQNFSFSVLFSVLIVPRDNYLFNLSKCILKRPLFLLDSFIPGCKNVLFTMVKMIHIRGFLLDTDNAQLTLFVCVCV